MELEKGKKKNPKNQDNKKKKDYKFIAKLLLQASSSCPTADPTSKA